MRIQTNGAAAGRDIPRSGPRTVAVRSGTSPFERFSAQRYHLGKVPVSQTSNRTRFLLATRSQLLYSGAVSKNAALTNFVDGCTQPFVCPLSQVTAGTAVRIKRLSTT